MARHERKFQVATTQDFQPGPCPACKSANTAEIGQYLNGDCVTIIYCRECNYQVKAVAELARGSQQAARMAWECLEKHWDDEKTNTGLLEEDP